MKHRIMLSAFSLLFTLPAAAEIYRCETDGVVAFSDRPCGSNQTLHDGGGGVSFIPPDENLPALAEAAQAFIRERRERIANRGLPRPSSEASPPQSSRARAETVYVPWPALAPVDDRDSGDRGRRDNVDNRPGNPGNDRYSPLNGPILGTRPDSAAFDRRNRDRDDRDR